jgi:dihydrolipoamide dehydrogenase
LGYFFAALGTKINIVQRGDKLIPNEDEDVSERFTEIWKKKHGLYLDYSAKKVSKRNGKYHLEIEKKNGGGKKTLVSDALLVAVGITPNTDILDVKKTGVKTNKHGHIEVNDYLQTSNRNIWALGDIIGAYGLKHSANYEAEIVFENALAENKVKANYTAMPHAIFSSPQIAGVGYTEQQLKEKKIKYVVGKYSHIKTGMGEALQDEDGFVKVLVDPKTRKFLGCHIMGTDAATLIHEVLVAMRNNLTADKLVSTIHIHPALAEVVQRAVNNALKQL